MRRPAGTFTTTLLAASATARHEERATAERFAAARGDHEVQIDGAKVNTQVEVLGRPNRSILLPPDQLRIQGLAARLSSQPLL